LVATGNCCADIWLVRMVSRSNVRIVFGMVAYMNYGDKCRAKSVNPDHDLSYLRYLKGDTKL
jgi:hypothetical protein